MPELPEVEVIRLALLQSVIGCKITAIELKHVRVLRRNEVSAVKFQRILLNQVITAVRRRGKFLWLVLTDKNWVCVVHLGMSGQILIQKTPNITPHTRLVLQLLSPTNELIYLLFQDQRTFGAWFVSEITISDLPQLIMHIAPDLFSADFDIQKLVAHIKSSTRSIKNVLLDQSVVSGIGNIYADESLWLTKINALQKVKNIPQAKIIALLKNCKRIMQQAIDYGGTSFDRLYVNTAGESGAYSKKLRVYQREGKPCFDCGRKIKRLKISGRSAHFCPQCQPLP